MNRDKFPDQRNQQGNKGRGKNKLSKLTKGDKRRSSLQSLKSPDDIQREGDRDPHRKTFERDDYFEIPMDVESDSTGEYETNAHVHVHYTEQCSFIILV